MKFVVVAPPNHGGALYHYATESVDPIRSRWSTLPGTRITSQDAGVVLRGKSSDPDVLLAVFGLYRENIAEENLLYGPLTNDVFLLSHWDDATIFDTLKEYADTEFVVVREPQEPPDSCEYVGGEPRGAY
jgi:hypothetical protein